MTPELLAHIEALNAKTQAWVGEAEGRWAGLLPTDEEFWAERGISTVEDYERWDLQTMIYEGFKDAYGYRNHCYDFDSMSLEELRAESDRICDAVAEELAHLEQIEAQNLVKFEEAITEMRFMGATSREDAIRWILESENLIEDLERYGSDFICCHFGRGSSAADMFKGIL